MTKKKSADIPRKQKRRCRQTKCGYFKNGGCKKCSECGVNPFIINTHCQRCVKCEGLPNHLRWGDKKEKEKESIKIPIREKDKEQLKEIIIGDVK